MLIVDYTPNHSAEWMMAAWEENVLNGSNVLCAYMGIHSEPEEHQFVEKSMKGHLLEKWWDKSAEAGPKSRPAGAPTIPLPPLKVCQWVNNRPVPVAESENKFVDTPQATIWEQALTDHKKQFHISISDTEPAGREPTVAGPDFSAGGCPRDMTRLVQLEVMELKEGKLDPELWSAATPPKNGKIGVAIHNDKGFCIFSENTDTVQCQEVCGMNTGTFEEVPKRAVPEMCVPFLFESDTDYVVLVQKPIQGQPGSKILMSIAEVFYHAFKKNGIPVLAMDNHTIEPLEGHFRFKLVAGEKIHVFRPTLIPPDSAKMRDGAHLKLKHAEIGAFMAAPFIERVLGEGSACQILWEVELDCNPPATIRALKPKLWLCNKVAMEEGKAYKV